MNTRILFAVVVSMFVCQQVHAQAEEEPVMPEATELEGTWEMVSSVRFGSPRGITSQFWRFEGNRVYYKMGNEESWTRGGLITVNSSAMPAEIDGLSNVPGIYEVEGNSLTICVGIRNHILRGTRPDRFESSEDFPTVLYVFRRVEEDDE